MRSIGIPVANRPECIATLEQAFTLGKALGADVVGYHIRPNRKASKSISLNQLWLGDNPDKLWADQSVTEEKNAAVSAQSLFDKMARKNNYEISGKRGKPENAVALYVEKTGSPSKLLPLIGPVNDLLMVSRPKTAKSAKAMNIMITSILTSRCPVLVLPKKKTNVGSKRIVIAWNRGKAETMLIHNSLPLLQQADEVVLLTVGRDHQHGPNAKEMVAYLKSCGVKARHKSTQAANAGKSLIQTFKQEKGDILLCGAYASGHLRTMVFGGMTKFLLEKSDIPIIFQHA